MAGEMSCTPTALRVERTMGSRMGSRHRHSPPEGWLNLFGTTCTAFLLLICILFIAITPIVPLPALIDFPPATSASKAPAFESDVIVSIRSTGETYLYSELIDQPSLARALAAGYERDRILRLRVDRGARFGYVRTVVEAAQTAGYERVVIMVRHVE
jgi:biopolymer transport protein ExbD